MTHAADALELAEERREQALAAGRDYRAEIDALRASVAEMRRRSQESTFGGL